MEAASRVLRQATRDDIPAIRRIRMAVHENTLPYDLITQQELIGHLEACGRGWVSEHGGAVVAFAFANRLDGNIWALFVDPLHQGRGHGRALHDTMMAWLWQQGVPRAWLGTGEGTRAQTFYERAGWRRCGRLDNGDLLYEKIAPVR